MPSRCAPFSAMQASAIGACLDWRRRSRAPASIQWPDFRKARVGNRFERLIASLNTERPGHIRDRAIILLLAVYGLRIGEVCALTLDDLDWTNEKIRVRRLKNKRIQDFPLTTEVGNAILKYLRTVRPQCSSRFVFLSLHRPHRPMMTQRCFFLHRLSHSSTWLPAAALWSTQFAPRLRHTSTGRRVFA